MAMGAGRLGQGWLGWSWRGIGAGPCSPRVGGWTVCRNIDGVGGEDRGEGRWDSNWKAGERRRESGGGRSGDDRVRGEMQQRLREAG